MGRVPRKVEFHARARIREHALQRAFSNWGEALKAAGFEPYHKKPLSDEQLLEDWGRVVRKLARRPKRDEYNKVGEFSVFLWKKRFGNWRRAARQFCAFARDKSEWKDVLAIVEANRKTERAGRRVRAGVAAPETLLLLEPRLEIQRLRDELQQGIKERPKSEYGALAFGDPIDFRRLRNAPVNESGVILLFGMLAAELGLLIEAVQPGFPDCEAKYRGEDGKWRRLRVEFEYESRNFLAHGHNPSQCDVIVCWKHNWKECPLHVIELSAAVKELKAA